MGQRLREWDTRDQDQNGSSRHLVTLVQCWSPLLSSLVVSGPSVHILSAQMLTASQRRPFYPRIAPDSKPASAGHSRSELFVPLGSTEIILSFSKPQPYRDRIISTMSYEIQNFGTSCTVLLNLELWPFIQGTMSFSMCGPR